jgi:hypothetical protein
LVLYRQFVKTQAWDVKPLSHDTAFYPKAATIRNHIHAAIAANHFADLDQDNLEELIKNKEAGIHFVILMKINHVDLK